jgi:hypothetical protein
MKDRRLSFLADMLTSLRWFPGFLRSSTAFFSKPVDYDHLGAGFQSSIWQRLPGSHGRVCVGVSIGFGGDTNR